MSNEQIVLKSNSATNLEFLARQARNCVKGSGGGEHPPFTRDEARKILWSLGTFQEDERARDLFMALHDSLQAH